MNEVFSIFDTWLAIASFSFLREIIGRRRISKYWQNNTSKHLEKVQKLTIGNGAISFLNTKVSIGTWFNYILNNIHNKMKLACNFIGHSNTTKDMKSLDFWLNECRDLRIHPEWLRVSLYQFPNLREERDTNGSQLIHHAAQRGRLDFLKLLVESKANLSINGRKNISTLSFAVMGGDMKVCRYLCENNISIDTAAGGYENGSGWFPIHWAAKVSTQSCVRLLLEYKANPFVLTDQHWNAFDIAANFNHLGNYSYLIENFIQLANEWNVQYTIEYRTTPKQKIFFILDELHLYSVPHLFAD